MRADVRLDPSCGRPDPDSDADVNSHLDGIVGASPAATGTATPTATTTGPTATPTASADGHPDRAETTAAAKATTQAVPEPTTSASQLKAIEANDPTKAELQACANARAEVLLANTNLQTVVTLLTTRSRRSRWLDGKKSSSSTSTTR